MGLIKCSCGSKLFWKSIRISGYWKQLVNENDEIEETDLDDINYLTDPKIVICAECQKRVKIKND